MSDKLSPHLHRTTGARVLFLASVVVLSVNTIPYRLWLCSPPPPGGDDSPEALLAGVAPTPFQYRVLVPWLVRGAIAARLIRPEFTHTAFVAVEMMSLVLLALVFRWYLTFFVQDRLTASLLALTVYAILPFNYFHSDFHPYDTPSLLFVTLGLTLIHERKWLLFYPLFALATLNRETSFFLTFVTIFVLFDEYPIRRLGPIVIGQLVVWVVVKLVLLELYRQNPSYGVGLYEFQLRVNIATLLTQPVKVIATLGSWGCVWLAVAVWYQRISDVFLKRTLLAVPLFVAVMFVVGNAADVHIYEEALTTVLSAFLVISVDLIANAARGDRRYDVIDGGVKTGVDVMPRTTHREGLHTS